MIFTANMQYMGDGKKEYSSGRFEARDLDTDAKHKEALLFFEQPLDRGELSNSSYVWGHVGLEVQETSTNLLVQYQLDTYGDVFMYWNLAIQTYRTVEEAVFSTVRSIAFVEQGRRTTRRPDRPVRHEVGPYAIAASTRRRKRRVLEDVRRGPRVLLPSEMCDGGAA
jgi:hypothetical protein